MTLTTFTDDSWLCPYIRHVNFFNFFSQIYPPPPHWKAGSAPAGTIVPTKNIHGDMVKVENHSGVSLFLVVVDRGQLQHIHLKHRDIGLHRTLLFSNWLFWISRIGDAFKVLIYKIIANYYNLTMPSNTPSLWAFPSTMKILVFHSLVTACWLLHTCNMSW